ncbi:hypothetical protein I4U23_005389 [Adineta vaga]|nr:hypothetical protein I4U23_005389 [Adineta vaga]
MECKLFDHLNVFSCQQSFMRPTSTIFAKAVCDHVGAKNIIVPYWPHLILIWIFGIMPTSWIDFISKKT